MSDITRNRYEGYQRIAPPLRTQVLQRSWRSPCAFYVLFTYIVSSIRYFLLRRLCRLAVSSAYAKALPLCEGSYRSGRRYVFHTAGGNNTMLELLFRPSWKSFGNPRNTLQILQTWVAPLPLNAGWYIRYLYCISTSSHKCKVSPSTDLFQLTCKLAIGRPGPISSSMKLACGRMDTPVAGAFTGFLTLTSCCVSWRDTNAISIFVARARGHRDQTKVYHLDFRSKWGWEFDFWRF